jgi:DDE superfamily endonuclease
MDPTLLYGATALAGCHVWRKNRRRKRKDARGRRVGSNIHFRVRRSIESVHQELGAELFRRAYRMTYPTFLELHRQLEAQMLIIHKEYQDDGTFQRKQRRGKTKRRDRNKWTRFVPNGAIPSLTRLAIALRYFAGGSLYDLCPLFGIGRTDAFRSVWMVVEATHRTNLFNLVFPADHDAQRELASQFSTRSQVGFDCCVGAVDGILIWILKPSPKCCIESKCDASKFFCGRKHKFGLNCQAVADFRGRFLDMSIKYPASTSDCLAFESSKLYDDLEKGILAQGLCLFGDNAYINSPFIATPYPNVSGGYKDAYNFFHSQLRIRVECAFGMFVHRWGILRTAIPCGISIRKTTSLVLALAKLHNFCIDQDDISILPSTSVDAFRLATQTNGSVPLEDLDVDDDDMTDSNTTAPTQLLGGGEHFDDLPLDVRQLSRRRYVGVRLPRELLAEDIVRENNYRRPRPKGTK